VYVGLQRKTKNTTTTKKATPQISKKTKLSDPKFLIEHSL